MGMQCKCTIRVQGEDTRTSRIPITKNKKGGNTTKSKTMPIASSSMAISPSRPMRQSEHRKSKSISSRIAAEFLCALIPFPPLTTHSLVLRIDADKQRKQDASSSASNPELRAGRTKTRPKSPKVCVCTTQAMLSLKPPSIPQCMAFVIVATPY